VTLHEQYLSQTEFLRQLEGLQQSYRDRENGTDGAGDLDSTEQLRQALGMIADRANIVRAERAVASTWRDDIVRRVESANERADVDALLLLADEYETWTDRGNAARLKTDELLEFVAAAAEQALGVA